MLYIIDAKDGSFRQPIEAETLDQALQLLAEHFEYESYEAMLTGLKYAGIDLEVSQLIDERNKRPESFNLDTSASNIVMRAFKALRQ